MAVPFATQQLIRIVTEKVIENIVARQQGRGLPALVEPATVDPSVPVVGVDPNAFNQLVRHVAQVESELKALQEKHAALEEKMRRLQQRWGWQTMLRVVVMVAVAFVLGAILAYGAHLGGWY